VRAASSGAVRRGQTPPRGRGLHTVVTCSHSAPGRFPTFRSIADPGSPGTNGARLAL
jgi:hypothetical protein